MSAHLQFNSQSGRKPQAEARRYIYRVLAKTLECDLASGAGYLYEDLEHEPDQRRAVKAAKAVLKEMLRKASR